MYVERVPNRTSSPVILVRESFDENGRVKKRTVSNLSHWPNDARTGPSAPPFSVARSMGYTQESTATRQMASSSAGARRPATARCRSCTGEPTEVPRCLIATTGVSGDRRGILRRLSAGM